MFAGVAWGVLTGDVTTAVSLAVFYELFWLDLFPAGTYMPPNSLFPMLTVFCLMGTMKHPDITTLFLPVVLTLPLAFFGAMIEKRQREWQVSSYNRIIRRLRVDGDLGMAASYSVAASLFQLFLFNFAAFCAATSLIFLAWDAIVAWKGHALIFAEGSWPLLWLFGAIGGVLALRIRRNYIIFVAGSACIGLLSFLGVPV